MDKEFEYITEEKRQALEEELKYLKSEKRKEILEVLEYAKSLGDLSENAEYHQAREEQAKLEDRITVIEDILKSAVIISTSHKSIIGVGSTVVVQKEKDKEKTTYQIVGSEEADTNQGRISNKSPLGEALFGRKKGDTITLKTPKGETNYKIVEIK